MERSFARGPADRPDAGSATPIRSDPIRRGGAPTAWPVEGGRRDPGGLGRAGSARMDPPIQSIGTGPVRVRRLVIGVSRLLRGRRLVRFASGCMVQGLDSALEFVRDHD